jgi:hypothetical protein
MPSVLSTTVNEITKCNATASSHSFFSGTNGPSISISNETCLQNAKNKPIVSVHHAVN